MSSMCFCSCCSAGGGLSSRYYVTCVCLVGDFFTDSIMGFLTMNLTTISENICCFTFYHPGQANRRWAELIFPLEVLQAHLVSFWDFWRKKNWANPRDRPKPAFGGWEFPRNHAGAKVFLNLGILSLQLFLEKNSAWGNCRWLTPQRHPPKVEQEKLLKSCYLPKANRKKWVELSSSRTGFSGGLEDHPSWIQ